jgi:hypothetical protein
MNLSEFLASEIAECLRRLKQLEFELNVDTGYVYSADADPADIDYFRCQVELATLEKEYLERKLHLLRERKLTTVEVSRSITPQSPG